MSNLLPIPAEREVMRAYRARLMLAASILLISMGVLAGIILLPSYLIIEKNRSALAANTAALNASAAKSSDRDLLNHIQSRVAELVPLVSATSSPSDLIMSALSLRPAGVSVDHINYSTGKTATVFISGASKTGDQVSAYQHALIDSGMFGSVTVPVGALAGVGDGRFNITIITK